MPKRDHNSDRGGGKQRSRPYTPFGEPDPQNAVLEHRPPAHLIAVAVIADKVTASLVRDPGARSAEPAPRQHRAIRMVEQPAIEAGVAGEDFGRTVTIKRRPLHN